MDNLRKLRSSPVRRVSSPRHYDEYGNAMPRLRGPARGLAAALDQLRAGVPLNWGQVEDDPDLAALAGLQAAAQECRDRYFPQVPPQLRADVLRELSARLPEEKVAAPVAAPRPLAGFSDAVPVLTQVDDNIPSLTTNFPKLLGIGVAVLVVLFAVISVGRNIIQSASTPAYTWLAVRQGSMALSRAQAQPEAEAVRCPTPDAHSSSSNFVVAESMSDAQNHVTFPISYLSSDLLDGRPGSSLVLTEVSLDSCSSKANPPLPGATVKQQYQLVRRSTPTPQRAIPGAPPRNSIIEVAQLTVFETNRQLITIDVSKGSWKEVRVGKAHGIYWRGGPYQAIDTTNWIGDVSLMVVEYDDIVTTFVGQADQGITEALLTSLVNGMEQAKQREESAHPSFAWIELHQGMSVLTSLNGRPNDWKPMSCDTAGASPDATPSLFTPASSITNVQEKVGFPILSLPQRMDLPTIPAISQASPAAQATAGPTGYTARLADISTRPCPANNGVPSDPGAMAKLHYVVAQSRSNSGADPAYNVVLIEAKAQPVTLTVTSGSWREVQLDGLHGVLWSADQFQDAEGITWHTATVLALEKGDTIVTLVAGSIPDDALLSIAAQLK